ncbi:MAG: hypothetical protein KGN02_14010 [bacterium]|nr:hypothetical protein [bacterium]
MTTLLQRYYLHCPYARARTQLDRVLRDLAESGETQVIRLRVPINLEGSKTTGLHKDVVVQYGQGTDPLHFDQPWTVRWTPHEGGPYPDFDGTLTVRADEDFNACVLELQGRYEPPFGFVGAAFDTVLGSRIASATAREFLRRIGRDIEARYHREEHEKGHRVS